MTTTSVWRASPASGKAGTSESSGGGDAAQGSGAAALPRCDSTLTRVVKCRRSVRDFAKKKTVIVRAGKKYIARAKKK
jgi:hypothetical protein